MFKLWSRGTIHFDHTLEKTHRTCSVLSFFFLCCLCFTVCLLPPLLSSFLFLPSSHSSRFFVVFFSDRESRIQGRIPVGSTFNVYANCLQSNNQLLLTLALKPDPILNYPVLPASGTCTCVNACIFLWCDIVSFPTLSSSSCCFFSPLFLHFCCHFRSLFYTPTMCTDVSASEPSSPLRERAPLRYRYLIILDFEATCDYSPKPIIDKHNSGQYKKQSNKQTEKDSQKKQHNCMFF